MPTSAPSISNLSLPSISTISLDGTSNFEEGNISIPIIGYEVMEERARFTVS